MKKFLDLANRFRKCPVVDDDFPDLRDEFDTKLRYLSKMLPKIVCLCGSTKFYDAFQKANYDETMAGNIALSVGFYPHSHSTEHGEGVGHDSEEKKKLDVLHKRKIDLCDEVFVLNVGGYIGESTKSEIAYAKSIEVPIRYLEAQITEAKMFEVHWKIYNNNGKWKYEGTSTIRESVSALYDNAGFLHDLVTNQKEVNKTAFVDNYVTVWTDHNNVLVPFVDRLYKPGDIVA